MLPMENHFTTDFVEAMRCMCECENKKDSRNHRESVLEVRLGRSVESACTDRMLRTCITVLRYCMGIKVTSWSML